MCFVPEKLTHFKMSARFNSPNQGHSQGGILGRYWMKYLDGAGKVNRMVGIAPITHGTTLSGLVTFGKVTGLFGPVQSISDAIAPSFYQMGKNFFFFLFG